jgi:hypothetical protein
MSALPPKADILLSIVRYSRSMPATLANLITNDSDLRANCDACGRSELLDIPSLVAAYGEDMALPEIGQRLRCTGCGAKMGGVQVVAVRW